MFSYFLKGIKNINPCKTIDFITFTKLVIDNPNSKEIEIIRNLRLNGLEYKPKKRLMPNITPNCIVKIRNLKEELFLKNFICFSGYIFFDLDLKDISKVDSYKEYIINTYRNSAAFICKSISGGGVTIFFRIKETIENIDQFNSAVLFIAKNILKEEKEQIDENCYRIGQPLFISSDKNAYVNYTNSISVELSLKVDIEEKQKKKEKGITRYISSSGVFNIPVDTYLNLSLEEILKIVRLKTEINVLNPVIDLKRLEIVEINYRKKKIPDTQKHKVYTSMIHILVYLNPDVHYGYIFAYLNYYNNAMADPPMELHKLIKHFQFIYSSIVKAKENGTYNFTGLKIKWVHTNKKSNISPQNRNIIANKLNGKRKSNSSIEKICEAKLYLESNGLKVTQKKISEITGISISSVKRHYRKLPININAYVDTLNRLKDYDFIKPSKRRFELNNYFIHPECPSWVFRQDDNLLR